MDMETSEKPSVNHRKTLHRGRVFDLVRENVTFRNGLTVDLDVIRHPGATAIVPLADPETLILLRQYRHAVGSFIWEIPAGTLDAGENPLQCARRELAEETGYRARQWTPVGCIFPVPGYSDEQIHVYLARELTPAPRALDPDEILDVHPVSVAEARRMMQDGRIQDAKTIAGLHLALGTPIGDPQ